MASEAQLAANRSNARKSTGPRTPVGKAVVARNGIKHGLLSRECLVKGESEADLVSFGKRLRAQLAPVGELELLLADRIISTTWRLRRLVGIETIIFNTEGPTLAYALRILGREKLSVLSRYEVSLEPRAQPLPSAARAATAPGSTRRPSCIASRSGGRRRFHLRAGRGQ